MTNELMNKEIYVFLEQSPLIVLDNKPSMCMEKKGKYTKRTRHISRRMAFVRIFEEIYLQ